MRLLVSILESTASTAVSNDVHIGLLGANLLAILYGLACVYVGYRMGRKNSLKKILDRVSGLW